MKNEFNKALDKIKKLIESNDKELLKNICTILKNDIYHYDWVGFYVLKGGELVLSDYAGKPTNHTNIAIGKGVCGQVAEKKEMMVVQDVNQIDNYISCSIDVQSEIVAPIINNGNFIAEIDIDSHSPAPFTKDDEKFLGEICSLLSSHNF